MANKKKSSFSVGKAVISLVLAAGLLIGNYALYINKGIVTQFLCGEGVKDDSQQAIAARKEGMALAQSVEEEGAVLLKNSNNVLPLGENSKVNVFGFSGSDDGFMPQGTGSGTGSRNDLVTFLGGLKEAGIEYNTELASAYDNLGWKRAAGGSYVIEAHGETYKDFYGVSEAPESFYTATLMDNAVKYSDTAVVVLGRLMGEGNDFSKVQYFSKQAGGGEDATRKLQSLSAREEYMIDLVSERFKNVILVINSGNPLELGIADTDKIDAVVNMGMPGTRGTIGLANILTGKVNPSGKLVDTWAYDLSTAASYATSGKEGVSAYTTNNQAPYTEYRENIYNGYLWYETADKEGFWDSDFAKSHWGIKNGYEDVVQYPFGYGLSYTNFEWELHETNFEDGDTIGKTDTLKVTVRVTNTGSVAGKDVVQMYYSAPYTKGEIEKSAIKLGAFAKTPEIQPGQFADVEIEMPVEEMKSYDCYDANNNGFMGYELEEGDYEISFRSDVHTVKEGMSVNGFVLNVAEDIRYEYDSATGTKVENQFTTYTNSVSGASSTINEPFHPVKAHSIDGSENEGGAIEYMTREDFLGTFPVEEGANRAMGDLFQNMNGVFMPNDPTDLEIPEFGSKATSWMLSDMLGVPYDDPKWDELISQMTYDRACLMVIDAGYGTVEFEEIGMPARKETDGPTGFNNNVVGGNGLKAVCYPSCTVLAQTWDWYLAYSVGVAVGSEGINVGLEGWYGPGGNVHRSAMGGRNFEYYSEDALISGTMLAYHVLGAKEEGVLAYIKHIGANEDDHDRTRVTGCYKWLTEQTLRENYLKSFEIAIKRGGVNGLMASATRTGGMRTSGSYALLTAVVRNEWGFRGTVITDYYSDTRNDIDEGMRAGCNQTLHPDGKVSWMRTKALETTKYYVHQAAKDFVYAYVETKFYSQTANGFENTGTIGTVVDTSVFTWWVPVLAVVNILGFTLVFALPFGGSKKRRQK